MKHKIIRSKMKKGNTLMQDPIVSRHVPETHWFKASRLNRMLQTYSTVYIKPDKRRKGSGVIRLKTLNNTHIEVSSKQRSTRYSRTDALVKIPRMLNPQKNTRL